MISTTKSATAAAASEAAAIYFATPAKLQRWFEEHHQNKTELILGYYKKATGIPSVTWSESVDEALCVGWIDGVRRTIDDERYCIRFTPRKPNSNWSKINMEKLKTLTQQGRMKPRGLHAWSLHQEKNSAVYSFEQKDEDLKLSSDYESRLRVNAKAWRYFETSLPPSAKKATVSWLMSAKQAATREKRFGVVMDCCEKGLRIPTIRRK